MANGTAKSVHVGSLAANPDDEMMREESPLAGCGGPGRSLSLFSSTFQKLGVETWSTGLDASIANGIVTRQTNRRRPPDQRAIED
jgi:hypothetical protein